ncbi:MAG TPA: hypothetical protein VG897_03420 [Terriglobales bacterium]|nr:hypothetical protein [Terriglobales bacterium]
MERLLQFLSLGFLLRCIVAGALGLASYYSAAVDTDQWPTLLQQDLSKLIAAALIVGTIVYANHRSVVYPIIESLFDDDSSKRLRAHLPLIRRNTVVALERRWRRTAKKDAQIPRTLAKHIVTWADYTHLQYASALAIWLGALVATINTNSARSPNLALMEMAPLFALSALVSDWRLRTLDEYCKSSSEQSRQVVSEAKAPQLPLGNWSMSEERAFIENLLCTRINFFLVTFALILTAAFTAKYPGRTAILWAGLVICLLMWRAIHRAHVKHDWIMQQLYSIPTHPAAIVNDAVKGESAGRQNTSNLAAVDAGASVSKLVGIGIPIACLLTLLGLAVLSTLRVL